MCLQPKNVTQSGRNRKCVHFEYQSRVLAHNQSGKTHIDINWDLNVIWVE